MSMKNSSDTIEPATFWIVAECLNRLSHRVPHTNGEFFVFCIDELKLWVLDRKMAGNGKAQLV
jgi:hypothetical protein